MVLQTGICVEFFSLRETRCGGMLFSSYMKNLAHSENTKMIVYFSGEVSGLGSPLATAPSRLNWHSASFSRVSLHRAKWRIRLWTWRWQRTTPTSNNIAGFPDRCWLKVKYKLCLPAKKWQVYSPQQGAEELHPLSEAFLPQACLKLKAEALFQRRRWTVCQPSASTPNNFTSFNIKANTNMW